MKGQETHFLDFFAVYYEMDGSTLPGESYLGNTKFEMFQTIVSSIHLTYIHIDTTFVWHLKNKIIKMKFWHSLFICTHKVWFISFIYVLNYSLIEKGVIYITYFYICYFCLTSEVKVVKMTAYPILIFIQSFVNFQIFDSKIPTKWAKRPFHTYLHTYILTYRSHRVSYELTKNKFY